jgi:hypothetical protein
MTATEYLGLASVVPAIHHRLYRIQPFPPSLDNSGRAPYGLSQMIYFATWRLRPRAGQHDLCVRVRDSDGLVRGPWCAQVALNRWTTFLPAVVQADTGITRSPYLVETQMAEAACE